MTCSKAHAYAKQHPPSWDNYSDEITIAPTKAGSYLLGLESKPDPFTKILMQLLRAGSYLSFLSCCKALQGFGAALRKLIFVLRMSLETDNSDLLGTWVRAKYDLEALKNCAEAIFGEDAMKVEAGQLLVDVACMLKPGAWGEVLARMALLGVEPCVLAMIDNLPILQGRSEDTAHPAARIALRGAMAHAVAGGHLRCMEALLKTFMAHAAIQTFMAHAAAGGAIAPIDVCLGGPFGALTLLMVASGTGQLACVQVLLEAGVDVNKHVDDEGSPMIKGQPAMNLSATVRAGTTALAIACENGRAEVAQKLLQHGAHRDWANDHCKTAAYFATTGGHLSCLKVLAGVAPELPDIGPRRHPFANDPLGIARTGLIGTAVMHGEADCLAYLLELLNDVPKALATSYHDGLGPLHRAALADDPKCLAPLAKLCAGDHSAHLERTVAGPGRAGPYWGWTPAMCALIAPIENVSRRHGSGAALAVLLEHNADPNNGRYSDGQALIHIAAERGAVKCLQLLILHGADPGARIQPAADQTPHGFTPIMSAAAAGHPECVRLLCRTEKGLETIDYRSQGGHTALMMSLMPVYHQGKGACPAENLECALVLLENGADPDLYNMGKTPLMSAATCADLGAICLLVGADDEDRDHPRRQANPNLMVQQTPHKGWTPLMLVVNAHSDEKAACLEVLLDAKADPNMRCDDGSPTALHYAIIPNNAHLLVPDAVETVPMLLRYGADVNARSAERGTPLHYLATTCGCKHTPRVMTMLLEAGADPKLADDAGDTPLMEASKRGPADDVQQLIEYGADPNQADRYGYTPLMAAANARLPECVSVLLKHGAKASRRDRRRRKTAREQCSDRFSRLTGKSMTEVELILALLASAEDHEQAGEAAEEGAVDQAAVSNHKREGPRKNSNKKLKMPRRM